MTSERGRARWGWAATVVLAALTAVSRAQPCSCFLVPVVSEVWPGPLTDAPRNTRVTATLPRGWQRWGPCFGGAAGASCAEGDYRLELRAAADGQAIGAEPIESPSLDPWAWDQPTVRVQLTPRSLLAPGARHELWVVPRGSSGKPSLLGTFKTGEAADGAPPSFEGVVSARYEAADRAAGRSVTVLSSCGETPAIELVAGAIADASEARYQLWQAKPGEAIDYGKPPEAVFRVPADVAGPRVSLFLQRRVACGGPTFLVPEAPSVKIGVRAVDVAGNASAPSEIEVRLMPYGSSSPKGTLKKAKGGR